jgi:hypothetical protein
MRLSLTSVKPFLWVLLGVCLSSVLWLTHHAYAQPTPPGETVVTGELQVTAPLLNYQGRLLDPVTGAPKPNGAYRMVFSLYDVASGGAPLWSEVKTVTVTNGAFTTLLGDTTALIPAQFDGRELWLGVSVSADPEATPRQRVGYTAYALYARNAETIGGQTPSAFAPASHSHSGNDITSGTVAEARIDSAITRDNEVMSIILANDGSGSGINADLLDGIDSASFSRTSHNHDDRYFIKGAGTQFTGTLAPGNSSTTFTFGWPQSWYVIWMVRPTTASGKITFTVDTELSADGNLTYFITVRNTGTITTNFAANYIVLR